jgi:hypothetical protein
MLKNMNERMKELAEIAALTMSSAYHRRRHLKTYLWISKVVV